MDDIADHSPLIGPRNAKLIRSWLSGAVLVLALVGCSRADPRLGTADDIVTTRAFAKMEAEQKRTDCLERAKRRVSPIDDIGPTDPTGCTL